MAYRGQSDIHCYACSRQDSLLEVPGKPHKYCKTCFSASMREHVIVVDCDKLIYCLSRKDAFENRMSFKNIDRRKLKPFVENGQIVLDGKPLSACYACFMKIISPE